MDSVDAKQMVEVIGEFQQTQRERLEAAKDMLAPYAIRALLDGANPKELAALCGFTDEPQEETVENSFAAEMRSILGGGLYGYQKPDALTLFTNWLTGELSNLIKEGVGA